MLNYLLRRLLRSFVTLWLVVTLVFVVLRISGDPARAMLPDDASLSAKEYGLNKTCKLCI